MTGTVQRVGQAIALVGVAALLGLLVWKVAFGSEDGAADELARGFVETVRESGHPRLIVGGLAALVGLIVLLTYLGVELPREGG